MTEPNNLDLSVNYEESFEETNNDASSSVNSESLSDYKHFNLEPTSIVNEDGEEQSSSDAHVIPEIKLDVSENIEYQSADDDSESLPSPWKSKDEAKHSACQFRSDKSWLDCQFHDSKCLSIKKPDEIENDMDDPPENYNIEILNRIQGSMFGMAIGDALGAHVEFRPRDYLRDNPVEDLQGGGTWGLQKGQFTDDTSMALCLANSLIARQGFNSYDQLVRYRWWYNNGYMSSTGKCFDIGSATKQSLTEFARRQKIFANEHSIPINQLDFLSDVDLLQEFKVYCSEEGVAGNGALMRLAPVPLFFYKNPIDAVEYSGISGQITHGDQKAYDACRYYGALIVAALHGETKEQLLDKDFYLNHENWFKGKTLHPDIMQIAEGSYQKEGGYDEGIRGKGYIVAALEAALWAFWSDENSFKKGVLAAVNLGDDTDTTAAIYGQLAGAFYGYQNLPSEWVEQVYAKKFIETLSKWIAYEGEKRLKGKILPPIILVDETSDTVDDTISTSSDDVIPENYATILAGSVEKKSQTDHNTISTNLDDVIPEDDYTTISPGSVNVKTQNNYTTILSSSVDTKLETNDNTISTNLDDVIPEDNYTTISPSSVDKTPQTDDYMTIPRTPVNVKAQDNYTTIPTSPVSMKPQEDYTTKPTSPISAKVHDSYTTIRTTAVSMKPHNEYPTTPTSPVSPKSQNNYTTIPITVDNVKPLHNHDQIPTTTQTSNLNPHITRIDNETSRFSSRHSERTFDNEPSYAFEPYKSTSTHYSTSINKQSFPLSTQIESTNDTRSRNIRESTPVSTHFSRDSTSDRTSTNNTFSQKRNLVSWTVNDVSQWIRSFGGDYSNYVDSFRKDKTDGFRLCNFINEKTLLEFGVKNDDHRRKILSGVQQVRKDFLSNWRK